MGYSSIPIGETHALGLTPNNWGYLRSQPIAKKRNCLRQKRWVFWLAVPIKKESRSLECLPSSQAARKVFPVTQCFPKFQGSNFSIDGRCVPDPSIPSP